MHVVDVGHLFVAGNAEYVDVVDGVADHLAAADETLQGYVFPLHFVCLFKAQFCCQLFHFCAQVIQYLAGIPFQDFTCLHDVFLVFLVALLVGTGAHAALDVIVQADLIFSALYPLFGDGSMAGAGFVQLLDDVEYGIHRADVAVGPKVGAPFLVDGAGLEDARQVFVGDADAGVGLPVFQQHVVARIVLLDELILQQQCVFLAVYHGIADVVDL